MKSSPLDLLSRHLRGLAPASLVLDIGCGTGLYADALAREGHRVIALDMDFDALATGRDLWEAEEGPRAARPSCVAARAEALPFPRGVFAAAVCLDVLHWAKDAETFEAMWRQGWDALAPGAIFIARVLMRGRSSETAPGGWFLPAEERVRSLLAEAGASSAEVFPDGEEGACWILARKSAGVVAGDAVRA